MEMSDVINFFFNILGDLWSLITRYWVLSWAIMITLIGFVIDLVKQSQSK